MLRIIMRSEADPQPLGCRQSRLGMYMHSHDAYLHHVSCMCLFVYVCLDTCLCMTMQIVAVLDPDGCTYVCMGLVCLYNYAICMHVHVCVHICMYVCMVL
jgi:hypothetical protein